MKEPMYRIPARYRKMENMHILFWLVKDISWCMIWKVLGIAMIFPTLIVAVLIAWRTRDMKSELAHNLAVIFWITANSVWMVVEFLGYDETPLFLHFEGRHLALIPFITGLCFLLYYYLFQKRKEEAAAIVTM